MFIRMGSCPGSLTTSHLILQLEKVYDPKNEEDDMREMEEERLRMREHVMKNVRGGSLMRLGHWPLLCLLP